MLKTTTKGDDFAALSKRFDSASKQSPVEFKRLRESARRAAGTESRRAATAVYNLPQARIAQDQSVTGTTLGFVIRGQRKPISSLSYRVRVVKGGLRLRVLKGGKTTTFAPGFLDRGKGRPFYRKPGEAKQMQGGRMRQPVHFLAGPSVADAMKDTRVKGPMQERIWGRVRKEFTTRISRLTRKK